MPRAGDPSEQACSDMRRICAEITQLSPESRHAIASCGIRPRGPVGMPGDRDVEVIWQGMFELNEAGVRLPGSGAAG